MITRPWTARGTAAATVLGCALAGAAGANDVEAAREGSLLKVFGDADGNTVLLLQTAAADVVVLGLAGTTVNGGRFAIFRGSPFEAIEVRMEGGDDRVGFSGITTSNDVFVNLGAGNDRVFTTSNPSSTGNNFTIEGEAGADTVRLVGTSVGQDLDISGGTGVLNVALEGVDTGNNLTVIGDLLDDTVVIESTAASQGVLVETKSGADRVEIRTTTAFSVAVSTDEDQDLVELADVETAEDVAITTGTGSDEVQLVQVAAGKNLTVIVDAGNDIVTGLDASAVADAVFDGGDGTDTLVDDGITGGEKKEIKDFEVIL